MGQEVFGEAQTVLPISEKAQHEYQEGRLCVFLEIRQGLLPELGLVLSQPPEKLASQFEQDFHPK